jgi:hypothetical protein
MARTRYNFWIDDDLRDGLRLVRERDGVLESEQIRRAIRAWLDAKGATTTKPSRAPRRRRQGR